MADDKNLRGGRDRLRISANEQYEIRYMAEKLGVSENEVRKAIQQIGDNREKVEEYLRNSKNRR